MGFGEVTLGRVCYVKDLPVSFSCLMGFKLQWGYLLHDTTEIIVLLECLILDKIKKN